MSKNYTRTYAGHRHVLRLTTCSERAVKNNNELSWVGGEIVGGEGGGRSTGMALWCRRTALVSLAPTPPSVRYLRVAVNRLHPITARSHHMPTAVDRPRRIYRRARAGAEVCSLSDPTITVRGRFAGQSTRQTIGLAVGVKGGIVAR